MVQISSRYRILQEFMDSPTKEFHMREISRRIKLAQPSVMNHLQALLKEKLIIKEKKDLYPIYRANRESAIFNIYKKNHTVLTLTQSGLLDYIYNSCLPSVIILFGSASRAEDIETSDVDIFIQSSYKKLDLAIYERQLKRKIGLFFEQDFHKLSPELKNNILNGIILKGYIKVF